MAASKVASPGKTKIHSRPHDNGPDNLMLDQTDDWLGGAVENDDDLPTSLPSAEEMRQPQVEWRVAAPDEGLSPLLVGARMAFSI